MPVDGFDPTQDPARIALTVQDAPNWHSDDVGGAAHRSRSTRRYLVRRCGRGKASRKVVRVPAHRRRG